MTHEEIIAMAKEAGATKFYQERQSVSQDNYLVGQAFLERFAALVAAKEREACAQVCELMRTVPPNGEPEDVERGFNVALRRSAAAIRARGQKEGR